MGANLRFSIHYRQRLPYYAALFSTAISRIAGMTSKPKSSVPLNDGFDIAIITGLKVIESGRCSRFLRGQDVPDGRCHAVVSSFFIAD